MAVHDIGTLTTLNPDLAQIKKSIYDKCDLRLDNLIVEDESAEYSACKFELNGLRIISRSAKVTPKKMGQFVTFWKRRRNGPIEPFDENDAVDIFVVNTRHENHFGQFVFPKSLLISKGIISTRTKEGKRAIRVYPPWDTPKSRQAEKTQKWQLDYFLSIEEEDQGAISRARKLYLGK